MSCNRTALNAFILIIVLGLGFFAAQIVDADEPMIGEVLIYAAPQQVDTDGDGRLESFSADYTVYNDGMAEGDVFIDDEQVNIQDGALSLTADGNVSVSANGVLVQEVGHWLSFQYEHSVTQNPNNGRQKILLLITDGTPSPTTREFQIEAQVVIR